MTESLPFLRRVSIRNYKSIAACDVELGKFTVIVGRNGSGKSNFLDALRFVAEGLQSSLDFAIKSRGGVDDVFSRSSEDLSDVGIDLELSLPDNRCAEYELTLARMPGARFRIRSESLRFQSSVGNTVGYETEDGNLVEVKLANAASSENLPKPAFDRLYLVTMAGLPEFRSVYDALSKMCFYNLSSEQMRLPHAVDSSPVLRRDGSNLASVAGRLFDESPELKRRLLEYLAAVVPEVVDVRRSSLDGFDYLAFQMLGVDPPWLRSNGVSDGTLRVLGNLIASMQFVGYGNLLSLIAIEEPETALHPAASTALMEALREASLQTQIVITSHSPDLLDALDPEFDTLLVAQIREGRTAIGDVDSVGASAIRDHLFSAGELLRMDQLSPRISVFSGANATTSADPRP